MKVRIIPFYLLRTLIPYLLASVGVLSAVIFMNQFVRIFNTAIMLGASLGWLAYSLVQMIPGVLALSLPMAFQLAVLLTLAAFSERGEVMAMRAAGFSFGQIVWPVGLCALLLSAGLVWLNNWENPNAYRRFRTAQHKLASSITNVKVEPGAFSNIGEWRLYAEHVDQDRGMVSGIHLFKYEDEGSNAWAMRISAPKGRFSVLPGKGMNLEMWDGQFQRSDPKDPSAMIMADYKSYAVFIPFTGAQAKREYYLTETTTPEILRTIKEKTLSRQREAEYKVEASTRMAMALSPLLFFWISCPLGLSMAKRNRAWGLLLSIAILFVFYGVMACGIGLGRKVFAVAWWAPFLADAMAVAVGATLWHMRLKS